MRILNFPDFLSIVKDRHILLDTNVFIDASINPTDFVQFLNELKDNGVTFVTLDVVVIEFTKGAQEKTRFEAKKEFLHKIAETCLPITENINKEAKELAKQYQVDGKSVSVTDFLLGATLVNYKGSLLLMTRNTNDFPTDIFNLVTCFNVVHRKGIFAYGLYEYKT